MYRGRGLYFISCVSRYSQECELQLEGRRAELVRWEGQLREEQGRQVALQEELCQAREQVKEERERREGVEGSLHETTRQLVELQRQKEDMQKALDKVSRYECMMVDI